MPGKRLFGTLILMLLRTFGAKQPFHFFPVPSASHGDGVPPPPSSKIPGSAPTALQWISGPFRMFSVVNTANKHRIKRSEQIRFNRGPEYYSGDTGVSNLLLGQTGDIGGLVVATTAIMT